MNGAKTARVGLTRRERRTRPGQMERPVFTLNSGYFRRWRLETGENEMRYNEDYVLIFLIHRINNTFSQVLAQVGLKSSGPGPEPEQKK